MLEAPVPRDEKDRLKALQALEMLDTSREERFDRITRMAQKMFDVPICTLTLVDAHREWFKSSVGVDVSEGPRGISFCGHAMLSDDLFVIEDAHQDSRFADNPMVIGKPFIRFYAGHPISNVLGIKVGAFCIKDTKPRTFSDKDREFLRNLAAWAQLELNAHDLNLAVKERNESVRALQESELRFRTLVESSLIGIFQTDANGGCIYVNSRYSQITGVSFEQASGDGWARGLHPEDRERVFQEWRQRVSSGEVFATEYRFVRPDGQTVWVMGVSSLLKDEHNAITGFLGNLVDITDQKAHEIVIRENEQRYRQILDAITDMVLVKGPQSRFLWANKAFRKFYGMNEDQLNALISSSPPLLDDSLQSVKDDRYVMETGKVLSIPDEPMIRHDGEVRIFHTLKSAIRDSQGRAVMTVGASRDVTEIKRSEQELKKNIEELKLLLAITVDRENSMIELKKQVNTLSLELKRPAPYDISFLTS